MFLLVTMMSASPPGGASNPILHGDSALPVLVTTWWVIFSSNSTRYHIPVDIVLMFSRPSSLTCLIIENKFKS